MWINDTCVTSCSQSQSRGPRIKHVCRRASVALGKPAATFSDITLSALPNQEKERVASLPDDDDKVKTPETAAARTPSRSLARSAERPLLTPGVSALHYRCSLFT